MIAHIDHGKCVAGKTRLYFSDGTVATAESFFDNVSRGCPVVKRTKEETIYDCASLGKAVFSLNKETGRLEHRKIKYAWKLRGGRLIKVKLETGFEVSTTPEHKYLVFDGVGFIEKRAKDISVGDRVICAKYLCLEGQGEEVAKIVLDEISGRGGYTVRLTKKFGQMVLPIIVSYGAGVLAKKVSELPEKTFIEGINKLCFSLKDMVSLCSLFGIPVSELYKNIEAIAYTGLAGDIEAHSFWGKSRRAEIKLPEEIEDLFYAAGFLFGNQEKAMQTSRILRILREIGVDDKKHIRLSSALERGDESSFSSENTFLTVLSDVFYGDMQGLRGNVISKIVFCSHEVCVSSFVEGYFDAHGTVTKASDGITVQFTGGRILRDIHLLLLRIGCLSSLGNNALSMSDDSAETFLERTGAIIDAGSDRQSVRHRRLKERRGSQLVSFSNVPVPMSGEGVLQGGPPLFGSYSNVEDGPGARLVAQLSTRATLSVAAGQSGKAFSPDIAYVKVAEISTDFAEQVYDFSVDPHHNFVAEGMVIHNTTLTDSLLSNAGLLSPTIAGEARALDYLEEEQARGITIKAANISLLHEEKGQQYVINMIDTPGHVDFSGNVTRALRVIDGAVVVVDAVEEVMVQTETVTKQAVEERVRPVLFINKIDRIIRELKLNAKQVQEKLFRIINDFNELIRTYAEPEFKDKWQVNAAKGTVAFGSALHGWGFTIPQIQAHGMKFDDIVAAYREDRYKKLKETLPVHAAILDMVVQHIPNPLEAQPYRIPRIWHGDLNSEIGKAMQNADDNGPLVMCLNNVTVDPHAGVVATGRVFSGAIAEGDQIYLILGRKGYRVQQVSMYMGAKREVVHKINAGNIAAVLGLDLARAGETLVADGLQKDLPPFERIRYVSEPVVTIAVEPKHARDLPKLVDVMGKMGVMDPNLVTTINKETGEYLLSGMGELHLEIAVKDIIKSGIEVTTSPPIVVYRETVKGSSPPILSKSPNKHNRIWITAQPMDEKTQELITSGKITHLMDNRERVRILREEANWDAKTARNIWGIDQYVNIMIDATKGVQYLREIQDTFLSGWTWATESGPLCGEPLRGVIFKLTDCQLHEDSIHRGPAQVMPMTRKAVYGSFLSADPALLEPIYKIQVRIPPEYIGAVSSVISQRRGQITNVEQKGPAAFLTGTIPVAETFGLASDLRSKTSGHAFWQTQFSHWSFVPSSIEPEVIAKIRKRRGMPPEVPPAEQYMDKL
ncbi:MAG: elongation factor EF-2 [Candidatus Ranarchaeia archaeon]